VRKRAGELRRLVPELRRGFIPMSTEMTLSLYSSGSVAFVGWRATTETVAVYSSAFRLYRLGLYFLMAMNNGLQGWVAEKHGKERGRRMLLALQAHAAVGLLVMIATVALMPWASTLLFGPTLAVDRLSSFFIGMTLMAISIGLSLGRHILIPEGITQGVWWPTLVGAAVGIPLSVFLSQEFGTAGATAALCLSQIVTLVMFVPRAVRVLRRVLRGQEVEHDVTPEPSPVGTM
jgi:O-antigen/teichoic acid export membrane protein